MTKEDSTKKDHHNEWREKFLADPERRAIYEKEAAKSELWFQLVKAREAAGLTQVELAKRLGISQAQVSRFEKEGYDAHTLKTLRKYVDALGEGYSLEVRIHMPTDLASLV